MTPKQLKASILQYAIQGKLVEQKPEEGNAEELYQQIQEEMQKLIKEGRTKKKNPLAEITDDEIPFDIPESWKWVRLGQILSIESGKGLSARQMQKGNIPVYGGNGVTGYHNEALIHKKTVVIGRVGFYCGSVHVTSSEAWVTDNAFITTYPEKLINREFLVYMLRHLNLGQNSNATAQPVVSGKKIYPILFPLPPLEEQKRIVAKIEELLPFVDGYEKSYEKLEKLNAKFPEDMKKSILQYAIQGKLVEQRPEEGNAEELYQQIQEEKQKLIKEGKIKKEKPLAEITDDEIPFDIPESWKWVRIQDLAVLNSGNQYEESSEGIPFIKVADLNLEENQIEIITSSRFVSKSNKGIIPTNSIIFPKRGGAIATNKKRIVKKTEVFIDSNIMSMTILIEPIFNYIKMWFDSIDLKKLQSGSSVPQINNKDIYPLCIPLPPLEEQHRIVAKIEELLPYCDQLIK